MPKRIVGLFAALLFLFSGIMVRLYKLTEQGYAAAADTQSTVTVTLATARGTIYDRSLVRLTNAHSDYAAAVVGEPAALAALADFYGDEDWGSLRERLNSGKPQAVTSQSALPLAEGILQYSVPRRYDESGLAAHVLGYVGNDGVHGACGVEQALDELLIASSGQLTVTYQTDGTGRVLAGGSVEVENTLARSNGGVALTLDSRIQHLVQTVGAAHLSRGAVVVMDVKNGQILAMASFPEFTAASLAEYLDQPSSPLFNRATAAYNCGSVFKTVTAMAALESGIPLSQSFPCLGALQVGENKIKCHHVLGHGTLTLSEGFAQSCNPYFIQLAQLTGGTALHRYASLLGFDSPVLLTDNYQTDRATLPSREEFGGSVLLANVSIGQGDLLATPVHVTAMTACVANGGTYYRPNLLYGTVDQLGTLTQTPTEPGSRVCSEATAATLRELMCGVVTNGTGKAAATAVGTAAGKTGTAQTGWKSESGDTMVHSWFTGFYPAEAPQYAITVLAEDSDATGDTTAPVFAELCDRLYRMGYVKTS